MEASKSANQQDAKLVTIVGPTHPYQGGVALHTKRLSQELRERGYDVKIESWAKLYPSKYYKGTQPPRSQLIESNALRFSLKWWSPVSWIKVGIRNRRRKLIFVSVTPFQYPILFVISKFCSKTPRSEKTLVAHNILSHEPLRFDRLLTRLFLKTFGLVITHNQLDHKEASHFNPKSICQPLPYHGFQTGRQIPKFRQTNSLLFLGFVRKYKGLDLLIEALTYCQTDVKLTVAGEFWDPLTEYQHLVSSSGLESKVIFKPGFAHDDEVVSLLDEADALVLPYRTATSTQLPTLARARKTPSIVTPVGDLPKSINHDVDGLVTSNCSPKSIALTIDSLYSNGRLERLRSNCQDIDVEKGWENYCDSIW